MHRHKQLNQAVASLPVLPAENRLHNGTNHLQMRAQPLDVTKSGVQTFVEELVRLPRCFLCYTPAQDAPPVEPSPAAAAGFVTFGSFNNLAKITPEVRRFMLWLLCTSRLPPFHHKPAVLVVFVAW